MQISLPTAYLCLDKKLSTTIVYFGEKNLRGMGAKERLSNPLST
jgi:hypothetical protein